MSVKFTCDGCGKEYEQTPVSAGQAEEMIFSLVTCTLRAPENTSRMFYLNPSVGGYLAAIACENDDCKLKASRKLGLDRTVIERADGSAQEFNLATSQAESEIGWEA